MQFIQTNKKDGFTLIEALIVISMMLMLSSIILIASKKTKEYTNSIRTESIENEIIAFVNISRMYCRTFNTTGSVIVEPENNLIKFKVGIKGVPNRYTLPSDFHFDSTKISKAQNKTDIDKFGYVTGAGDIMFYDRNEQPHIITILVGTADVDVNK